MSIDQQSASTRGLRLQTLVRLRWIAVIGQTAAVLFVHLILRFPLPLGFCLAVIALSAWLNIFLALRWRSTLRRGASTTRDSSNSSIRRRGRRGTRRWGC